MSSFLRRALCASMIGALGAGGLSRAENGHTNLIRSIFPAEPGDADIAAIFDLTPGRLDRLHRQARVNNVALLRMGPAMVARTLDKLDALKPDEPDEAMRWFHMQRADANGLIPRHALLDAKAQRDALIANAAPTEGGDTLQWEWLGPGNIGGRTRSMLINPANPDIMYAGSVGGGVWKTVDGGADWQPLTDFLPSIAVSSMAMDPNDPDTIYVGTGEGYFNQDSITGAGIFKSVDAGATFTQLPSTNNINFDFVNRIAMAPGSSGVMLAGTSNGIFRSTDAGQSFVQVDTIRTLDIGFAAGDPNLAIAGQSNGAKWSSDGGATWQSSVGASGGLRVEVAFAPSDPGVVYASAQTLGLLRSTDAGHTFVNITSQFYMGGQGWYDNALWVDPTDPNTVIVGGINLWRTRDAGQTWTEISQWQLAPASAHADQHFILSDPGFDGAGDTTVYFSNDGGLYKTDSVYFVHGVIGWQELNNNYGVTQFYGGAGNPLGTGTLVGGTQDNGTLVFTGFSEFWTSMFGGDGGYAAADQSQLNVLYGETQWGRIHRSSNSGASANFIYFPSLTDANPGSTNFISPFVLDPNGSARLYVGSSRLWRSDNPRNESGNGWTVVHNSVGSNHSAIAVADGDPDLVWVGHNNGDVYKTTDATSANPTWTRVDQNNPPLPDRFCTRIVIDPNNHSRVWATFSGFSSSNIWLTEDGGQSWVVRAGTPGAHLPALPVNGIVLDQIVPERIFIGTDLGVFLSEDDGLTWTTDNLGPANTVVDEVFTVTMGGVPYLVAVTHGRGMYRLPLVIVPPPNPADLSGDGVVDGVDLAILTSVWGTDGQGSGADLNGDGVVNGADLASLLSNWG